MRGTMNKLTQGATRLLVLALGLGLVSTVWAATPVAEWGLGGFPVSAAGSYDNMTATSGGYTISKNNGYNISTANYIQVAPSSVGGGWPIVISGTDLSALTVVVAFSLDEDASGSLVGLTTGRGANRFYAYLEDGAMYAGYNDGGSNKYGDLSTTVPTDGTIHYLVFAYGKEAGTQMFYDGVSKYNASGLKEGDSGGNSGNTSEITVGAQRGPKQIINGVKFHYIAVYDSKLGDTDALAAYFLARSNIDTPLAKYEKWSYAKALLTWTTSGDNELASSNAKYTHFDIYSGSNTETVYNGAGTNYRLFGASASEVFWHYICDSGVGAVYSAPGVALRFSGDTAGKTIGGTFGPVAFGGIYVENGATGYSFSQTSGEKRDNIWGDPSNTVETWFAFEESFEVNRAGSFFFAGTVNLNLPESSDVLTLQKNSTYTGYEGPNPVIVKTYTQQANGVALSVNNATLGGTLKMHGAGHMDVTKLTANGATLDFSDAGNRNNDATPFINGELVVNADTKFVFPTGATFPYKVATAISGTAPTTDTVYTDANGNVFTGPISIDAENGTVTFDPLSASTIEVNGALTISGATAANINIPAGKTLTLASGAALTGTVTGSGTVVCNQVDLSGAGFDNASGWTGKVQIAGDASMPTTYFDESSYGNANSTLEIASGHVAITAATALPGTVNVASGATLYMTSSSITDLAISGTNSGTVNLAMASNITTLTLGDGIASGAVVYPSSLTTLNVTLKETVAYDGEYSISCGSATPTTATLTLTRPDGTTVEEVTGTIEGSTVSFSWTPAVSGKACWVDYEMEYESGNASKTGFENSGTDTTGLHSDSGIEGDNAFYNGMLYTYAHPWRDMTGNNAYPSSWTAVVRCTVPAYENAAIITFGTCGGGLIGLVAGADPETQMKLVKTTGNSAFTVLSTMTVQNATTAQHVYVFEVENNSTIKVYCDGEQVLNETYSAFTLGGGIQIGSVHGGVGNTGIVRFAKNESPANTLSETVQKNARIDCVRLYKATLGPNAIAQLSEEFPAVKLFQATISGGDNNEWATLGWTGGDITTLNQYSKIILTVEDDATLTLPSSITAEDFIINVASGKTLSLVQPAGGVTLNLTHPLEVNAGAIAFSAETTDLNFAIAGTGCLDVGAGKTVSVVSGGSLTKLSGSGTVSYAAVPASALSFSGWTGTVSLPAHTPAGENFNNYGVSGSKVVLAGPWTGWIASGVTFNPEIVLNADLTVDDMSSYGYTFAKVSGTGTLGFGTKNYHPTSITITEVATNFTGSITNGTTATLTITTLARPAGQATTAGTKLLSTSGNVVAGALTVGGVASSASLYTKSDGIYIAAASVTINDETTYYDTVSAAVAAFGSTEGTLTLLSSTDASIALSAGQTLVNGNLTTGGVTGPNGYEVVDSNGTYTLVDNTASTWAPAENSDNNWGTAANWSTGYLPSQYTVVTFPASESAHVVKLTLNNANSEAERHRCASMVLNGNVTFQRANSGTWAYVFVYGNVTGTGTLTFEQTGLNTPANSSIAVSCPVVGNAAANDNFFSGTNATYTFSAAVDIAAGEFKADRANLVFSGPVTIRNGGYVKSNGEGASATFNGGINVPAGASASLTVNGGSQHTIASTVTLGAGATFTIPTATTVSGATFTAASGYEVVQSASGNNTVYTTKLKGATVSDVSVSYGADYASARVTATVSDTTLDYYISWASGEPVKGSVSGSQVTFDVSGINHTTEYQSAGYTITAKDGETAVTTTGGSGTSVAADTTPWFSHNSSGLTGGAWSNAVDLSEGPATVEDNTFTATAESTSSRVVLEFEVCFSSTSEEDVSGEAQAAIKLGEVNSATTFMVLTTGNEWAAVSNAELAPDASETYKVVLTIDYGSNAYGVTVGNCVMTNSTGAATFPLATSKAHVQNIDFAGSGTLTSMKGDQLEGYMVKDALNHFYATIEAATQAYNSANGPYTVLHDGTAPSGWKIDNATKKLIKIAKGLFFMAY